MVGRSFAAEVNSCAIVVAAAKEAASRIHPTAAEDSDLDMGTVVVVVVVAAVEEVRKVHRVSDRDMDSHTDKDCTDVYIVRVVVVVVVVVQIGDHVPGTGTCCHYLVVVRAIEVILLVVSGEEEAPRDDCCLSTRVLPRTRTLPRAARVRVVGMQRRALVLMAKKTIAAVSWRILLRHPIPHFLFLQIPLRH